MNIRTLLNEIKQDIRDYNFNYMEYESNIKDWDRTFILDIEYITFHYRNNKYEFTGNIYRDDFIKMSNVNIIKYIIEWSYYNTLEVEI